MRAFELASLAAQAEGMRMRHRLRRGAVQAVMAVLGLSFLLGAVVVGHVALFVLLDARLPRAGALGCIAGMDLVLAVVLVLIAVTAGPTTAEREARTLSRTAASEILPSLNWARLVTLLLSRMFGKRD
jgi:hypothetical protein